MGGTLPGAGFSRNPERYASDAAPCGSDASRDRHSPHIQSQLASLPQAITPLPTRWIQQAVFPLSRTREAVARSAG